MNRYDSYRIGFCGLEARASRPWKLLDGGRGTGMFLLNFRS